MFYSLTTPVEDML